jgi:prepilin-type N-terminal cleavage/methylation domain-containing protein
MSIFKKHVPRQRSVSGFTLIELIMTIIVVGLVSIPLSLLIAEQVESAVYSKDSALAFNLARFEIEKMNNTAYASISSASFSNYQGYSYDVNRTVSYVNGDAGTAESTKKITVIVTRAGGGDTLATLITYVTKNVSYGP